MPPILTTAFLTLAVANFLFFTGLAGFVLLPLHLQRLGATDGQLGGIMACYSATAIVVQPVVGAWVDRGGRRTFLVTGAILTAGVALLFAAARADHLHNTIEPALARGAWVVCDRFIDSTRVYQGSLGRLDTRFIRALERLTVGELVSFLAAILMLYKPLKDVTRTNLTLQLALSSASRIFEVVASSPQEFSRWIDTEIVRWGAVIKETGAKAD